MPCEALTPIIAKYFERLVRKRLKSALLPNIDQHQYPYRENRFTEDAITTALHTALTHLDTKGTYTRLLYIDFRSAFNMIIPNQLVTKLLDLGVNKNLCNVLKTSSQTTQRQ